jgi:hypothetical protein
MLTFLEVEGLIETERRYQDRTYKPEEATSTGVTRAVRDLDPSTGILMLEAYVRKATDAWVNDRVSNTPALQQVAKIAAIAVRILERAGGSEKLLEVGLR